MTEYLLLLKLDPAKLVDTMDALRDIPEKAGPGLNLHYLMNVFGTWDVAMWFDSENSARAVDFAHKKLAQTPGVVDVYAVPAFPNKKLQKEMPAEITKVSEDEMPAEITKVSEDEMPAEITKVSEDEKA